MEWSHDDRKQHLMPTNAWRQERETPSLSEVFRSIAVGSPGTGRFRRFLAFIGPGYLVAVGYMDPGNWATSLAGGAAFGYPSGSSETNDCRGSCAAHSRQEHHASVSHCD